jgi:hypothetical protein
VVTKRSGWEKMNDFQFVLKENATRWLLERENPSVRYFTLTEFLGEPESDREVREAKNEIMKVGAVPSILTRQSSEGWLVAPHRFYTAKYKGTVWQLIILAELGADAKDERVKKACEFVLANSQDRERVVFPSGLAPKQREAGIAESYHA